MKYAFAGEFDCPKHAVRVGYVPHDAREWDFDQPGAGHVVVDLNRRVIVSGDPGFDVEDYAACIEEAEAMFA